MPGSRERSEKKLYLGGFHPYLEGSLSEEIGAARAEDPLSPIIVLVGSNLLGLYLRRFLAKKLGSVFHVRFMTFLDLASSIASQKLAQEGKSEIPPLAEKLIIEEFLKKDELRKKRVIEYFSDIARYDGFRDAIIGTLEDLKEAGITKAEFALIAEKMNERDASEGRKFRELSKIHIHYDEFLQKKGLYDRSDLLLEAIGIAGKAEAPLRECFNHGKERRVSFFIYGFYDFSFIQKKLLEECIRGVHCSAFFPYRKKKDLSYRYSDKTRRWFDEIGFRTIKEESTVKSVSLLGRLQESVLSDSRDGQPPYAGRHHDDSFQIISAPGEIREAKEIVRKVTTLLSEDVRFEDIGIIVRNREDYIPLIGELFESSDIPFSVSRFRSLARTREGRALLFFLSLRDGDYYRGDVMQFITLADLDFAKIFKDPYEPSVSEWDVISMKAGIVRGKEEWFDRLGSFIEGLKSARAVNENGEAALSDEEKIEDAARFFSFVQDLFSAIDAIPAQGAWSGITEKVVNAFRRFVAESATMEVIEDALKDLDSLEAVQETTGIAQYQKFVREKLESSYMRKGKFQAGAVAVADLAAVRGIGFRIVIAPGLVERRFPALIRQDPILLDRERQRVNDILVEQRLSIKMERIEEEKLLFDLLVSSASERLILSYPRIDPDTASERVPSFFLLKAAETIAGERVDFDGLEKMSFFVRTPLAQLFPPDERSLADELECNLKLMTDSMKGKKEKSAYFLSHLYPSFRNALLAESSRWGSRKFTPYDGVFQSKEALGMLGSRYAIEGRTVSASSLENYASCPFRYFCDKILGLEILEIPEEIVTISALDRGTLLHDILFDLYETLKKERKIPFDSRYLRDYLRIVDDISEKHFQEMEKSGRTGFELMWKVEKARMRDDLMALMELEVRSGDDLVPTHFEVRFGMPGSEACEGTLSTDRSVEFAIDGKRKVFFKGRIDRIDCAADGKSGRVIDYKSGAARHKNNAFMQGQALQLPIYIISAESIMREVSSKRDMKGVGDVSIHSAQYFYTTRREGFRKRYFDKSDWEKKMATLRNIIGTISHGIENGIFFQTGEADRCRYCDYALLCGTAREIRFNRKKDDDVINDYRSMMEME